MRSEKKIVMLCCIRLDTVPTCDGQYADLRVSYWIAAVQGKIFQKFPVIPPLLRRIDDNLQIYIYDYAHGEPNSPKTCG